MKKIYTFLIVALTLSSSANAQSPAQNLMPDGSHDMYLGLGLMSRPLYEGAEKSKRVVIPVMQMQWSNGVFLAGMSAGWHLSNQYKHEFGPLITVEPNRNPSGVSNSIQFPNSFPGSALVGGNGSVAGDLADQENVGSNKSSNKLQDTDNIRTRLLYGTFYNYQIDNNVHQTNTLLFGAGNNRQGIRLSSDLRFQFKNVLPHHQFTVGLGLTAVNRSYAQTYFGVNKSALASQVIFIDYISADLARSATEELSNFRKLSDVANQDFKPRAGIKDVHADIFWNWSLSSSWLVTSKLSVSQLVGSSSKSPLVERKTNVTVSSAIAYRF